ncbi:MAG: ribosome-associated translation inhibitor RaiA [Acidobacteriales bacterium]|nr:ribosome-associated translation inhibitor RaiA [Terriglobales bacterium]
MNVEYTGRQYEITPAIRKQIETALNKIQKFLGDNFDTHVILAAEKHRHKAEITITIRNRPIVGVAEANDMASAVGEALDRIDRQAVKYKARWRARKRVPKKKWAASVQGQGESARVAVGASVNTAVPVVVHAFPAVARTAEAHVVRTDDSVALKPMTLEEAIKECEFRDREVFVFRDPTGKVKVLHRRKDGKMELIEAP